MGVGSFTLPQNADVVTGTGTANKIAKFIDADTLGDSQIEDNGSRVWIGGTDNGVDKLQVNGSGSFTGNVDGGEFFGLTVQNIVGTANSLVGIKFSPALFTSRYSAIFGVQEDGNNSIGLTFVTGLGGGITEKARITASGNVLIGTTTDNGVDKLQVNGSIKSTSSVQVGANATVESASLVGSIRYRSTANSSFAEMCMQTGASTYAWVILKENSW